MRRLAVAIALLGLVVLGRPVAHAFADTNNPAAGAGSHTPSADQVIATAKQYLGYPYAYIGDDPSTGFSCIGFIHFIFAQNGVYVPEELSAAYTSAPAVDQKNLQPGDLVFFQDTVWSGISHVDLYIGGGKMIGADSFQTGVQVDTLSDTYWQEHYLGATRPLSDPSGTPPNPAATPPPSSGPSLAPPSPPDLRVTVGTSLAPRHAATVHSGPGDTYLAIDTVTPSTTLTAVQTHGQWVNVSYGGGSQFGWVYGPDLDLSTARPAPATPSPSATPAAGAGDTGAGRQPATPATARRDDSGKTFVVPSSVPVYSGPTAADEVFMSLGAGTKVTTLRTRGSWDQVVLPDGTVGWVSYAALGAPVQAPRSAAPAQPHLSRADGGRVQVVAGFHAAGGRVVVVVADVLFVRAGPGGHTTILRRVHAGDHLHVLATRHGWDYVALRDNSRGWVSARWVHEAGSR